jgi:hypothetical protein
MHNAYVSYRKQLKVIRYTNESSFPPGAGGKGREVIKIRNIGKKKKL